MIAYETKVKRRGCKQLIFCLNVNFIYSTFKRKKKNIRIEHELIGIEIAPKHPSITVLTLR